MPRLPPPAGGAGGAPPRRGPAPSPLPRGREVGAAASLEAGSLDRRHDGAGVAALEDRGERRVAPRPPRVVEVAGVDRVPAGAEEALLAAEVRAPETVIRRAFE